MIDRLMRWCSFEQMTYLALALLFALGTFLVVNMAAGDKNWQVETASAPSLSSLRQHRCILIEVRLDESGVFECGRLQIAHDAAVTNAWRRAEGLP